jgi:RNA polymerase sigma-70 factor (ECF subfamily)
MMGPEILGQLLDDHAAALTLYARQWCAAAEDVVQEVFIKLTAQRPAPEHVVPWLYRAVRNRALTARRSETRRRHHEQVAAQGRAWFIQPEASTLDIEQATQTLQALPVEQREVIVAHLWGGLSFAQVADVIGISSSTAHRRYIEGLTALRERLREPCPKNPSTRN